MQFPGRARRVGAVEPVENERQQAGWNSLPIVLFIEYQQISFLPGGEDDFPIFGCAAQGIGNQVAEDLRHTVRVQADFGAIGFALHFPRNFLFSGQMVVGLRHPFEQSQRNDWFAVEG